MTGKKKSSMLSSTLRVWLHSLYFGNKNGYFENFFLKKGDILKSAFYTCQHPTYGFLVQTPVQLRFGRERVLLETKMPLNSDTVIASVGTCGGWGGGQTVTDSIWKKVPLQK